MHVPTFKWERIRHTQYSCFFGQYYDADTGHHYNINRDYDPVTGRYTQSDPVGFKGGVNTYAYAEANPVMKKDAMGLWASSKFTWIGALIGGRRIHQIMNHRVFGHSWMSRIFDDMTVAVDTYKTGKNDSYFHAMSSIDRSVPNSVALANEHVRSGFGVARYYINRGDGRNAYRTLGWVLHTMQDSTSPAHKYFQEWNGATPGFHFFTWLNHVIKESFLWQIRPGLNAATRWTWHMFYYRLVPTGNVFIF